ncbi:MAG: lysine--tRNA ligase [Verrucomicrobia bacterium]|nr:lysine--tRNA ligase [Verrucomicrobiota bacterium]
MSTNPLVEIRNIRLGKAASLRGLGLNPYPSRCRRTHYAKAIVDDFAGHEGRTVTVAGRLMAWRKQGALAFGHVQDQSGRIQLFLRRQLVHPSDAATQALGYADLPLLDLGDVIEATGKVIKTERGEISVLVEQLRMLTKAIRPLPDQWSGLKDREQVLRKRYLDVILDRQPHERFAAISRMLAAIRAFLDERGFAEFPTPVIQPQYGGGTAKPFKTHVNALGCDMYLAISHELYLKRLIVAGFDKVYTIGRYFRNEGIDRSHHPEFSMVETMTAYENYEYNMNLIEDMFRHVALQAFGRTQFNVRGHLIDFAQPWRRVSMADAVKEKTGVDFRACQTADEANAHLAALGIHEPQLSVGEALVKAFELVEPDLIQPTLVFGHPVEISPLAKPLADDPRFVERFEIFIAGMECGDNWSEQNDPAHLLETWQKAYRAEERDQGKFHTLDFDFIEALEYGMPPTTGIGPGIERMAMIFTEQENIDDVIFFPLMRPSVSALNASIFGVQEPALAPVEDLVLSCEDFEALCDDGVLKPHAHHLTVTPHVRLWGVRSPLGRSRASGHVDIEGFLPASVLRLAGYKIKSEEPLSEAEEQKKILDLLDLSLVQFLRKTFPECQVTVSPATVLRSP